jgi:hypothetical protein
MQYAREMFWIVLVIISFLLSTPVEPFASWLANLVPEQRANRCCQLRGSWSGLVDTRQYLALVCKACSESWVIQIKW